MEKLRRALPVCIVVIILAGIAWWICSYFRPVEAEIPEFDKIVLRSVTAWDETIEITDPEEIEKIAGLLDSAEFARSFRKYTEAPPTYSLSASLRSGEENLLSLWVVEEEYSWASTRVILHPLVDGKRLVDRECEELASTLLSYMP